MATIATGIVSSLLSVNNSTREGRRSSLKTAQRDIDILSCFW
jgi:hypothetical protein